MQNIYYFYKAISAPGKRDTFETAGESLAMQKAKGRTLIDFHSAAIFCTPVQTV